MYPGNEETIVETTKLSKVLMGKIRPGHFRGVATVCNKLFNIAQPDEVFFGEKDFQQVAVIKRMISRPQHAGHRRPGPDHAREATASPAPRAMCA